MAVNTNTSNIYRTCGGRKRRRQVPFRVTESEYEMLVLKAKKTGLSMQEYMVRAIKESVITSDDMNKTLIEIEKQIQNSDRQLKGIANNINQMARSVNAGIQGISINNMNHLVLEIEKNRRVQLKYWQYLRLLIEGRVVPPEQQQE